MIPGPIKDAGIDAIRTLIADRVPEGKTIEYKREMPGGADKDLVSPG